MSGHLGDKSFQEYEHMAVSLIMDYGPKLVLAILTLIIGLWVIKRITNGLGKVLLSRGDETLSRFLTSVAGVLMKLVLVIIVASMVGIETTSLVALVGAAGLAVGLALQGSLANFAGGVLILIFKPFRVGDLIEAQGHLGVVKEIQIFNTVLLSVDNRKIVIPNGPLSNGSMVNINAEPTRRVDFVFGISYSDDIDKTKALLNRLIDEESKVLENPGRTVVLSELADSSVNFTVRVWVNTADYWDVYFNMHENVKKAMDQEGISIPFPQRDVHMIQDSQ